MSDDPVRLRADPNAPPWLREAFDRAAQTPLVAPDAAAALARFEAARAADTASSGDVPRAEPTGGTAGGARWPALPRAWWGAGVIGLAGLATWIALRSSPHGASARASAASAPVAEPYAPPPSAAPANAHTAPPSSPSSSSPSLATASASANPTEPPPDTAPSSAPTRAGSAVATTTAPARRAAPPADVVAREFQNLAQVRAALSQDPARALALATAGHREFPGGVVREEREALAIVALARLGRAADARTRARAFLARYPRGVFADQVRRLAAEGRLPESDARRFR